MSDITEVEYILNDKDFAKLYYLPRHGCTDTYNHSINVAIIASRIAKLFGVNSLSALKVGLLHDFCLYSDADDLDNTSYITNHPIEAVRNSKKFNLSKVEEDAILTHMFPIGSIPKSRLGWVVRIADILASIQETAGGYRTLKAMITNKKAFAYANSH